MFPGHVYSFNSAADPPSARLWPGKRRRGSKITGPSPEEYRLNWRIAPARRPQRAELVNPNIICCLELFICYVLNWLKNDDPSRAPAGSLSLEGMHGSVDVPLPQAGFWRQWRAFVGPAVLVSVGYMDPGNWGTDLQGGAQYKYGLLWVIGLASLM